jgi:hypothetical protein
MMQRNWNDAVKVLAAAAMLAAMSAALLIAKAGEDDDRPPIIVHNGSLIFDGGVIERTASGEIINKTHSWSKDTFLDEWKPAGHFKGVKSMVVTVADVSSPSACAATTMSGKEVLIEYRTDPAGPPTAVMRVHLRRKHLIFKREPKIDPNGKDLVLREHTSITPTPPMLVYEDGAKGWISKVTVDRSPCEFARPPDEPKRLAFRVRIQPKRN